MRRFLDHDPITGITTWHEYDPSTKETHIHHTFEDAQVDAVLDRNKALYNHDDKGWSPTKEWRRVAEIPNSVILSWKINKGIDVYDADHWPAVRRLLNDSEWRYLRNAPGVV